MSNGLRERVARVLCAINDFDPTDPVDVRFFYESADAAIGLVLEEAAKELDRWGDIYGNNAAAAIRALKDKA